MLSKQAGLEAPLRALRACGKEGRSEKDKPSSLLGG